MTCSATPTPDASPAGQPISSSLSNTGMGWFTALTPSATGAGSLGHGATSTRSTCPKCGKPDTHAAALRAIIGQYDAFDRSGTHQQSGLAIAARIAREALAQGERP
jgi:hypothetical protein